MSARRGDAAFGDQQAVRRDARGQALGDGQVGGEGAQVAVVDADQGGAERHGAVDFRLVVGLDQGVHAEPRGLGQQLGGERRRR